MALWVHLVLNVYKPMKYKFEDDFYYDLHNSLDDFKKEVKDYYGAVKVTEEDIFNMIDFALKEEMERILDKLIKGSKL